MSKRSRHAQKQKISASAGATTTNPQWVVGALGGGKTGSGVVVSQQTSLTIAAVYTCVRILAESVAGLPLILYRRDGRNKVRATDHPLYSLLHDSPNDNTTSFEFREQLQGYLGLSGNGYALIERDARGVVSELIQLASHDVTPRVALDGRTMFYDVNNVGTNLPSRRILHLKAFSLDGLIGLSPIAYARETLGLSLAAEGYASRVFESDATPKGALTLPTKLDGPGMKTLRDSWNETHRNKREIAILHSGMQYAQIGMSGEDIQYIESRKFSKLEIACLFRIPPHMLAELEKSSFSSIEQQGIDFIVHCLRYWLIRWEQRLNHQLLLPEERGEYYFEFLVDALSRGDLKARYEAYNIGRNGGWLSANDILEKENSNTIDGGDVYLQPLNMASVTKTTGTKENA
jgi:HK97 family phage portal protein